MGDIGTERETVRFVPLPKEAPVPEPSVPVEAPVEVPAEPVEVPA